MPSSSKKQHNFMAAIANNPAFAKKVGVPQSVGKDFTAADKGKKLAKGGGLYDNIHAKRKRIAEGSGEKMRKVGSEGAPTAADFRESAKTESSLKDKAYKKLPEKKAGGGGVSFTVKLGGLDIEPKIIKSNENPTRW